MNLLEISLTDDKRIQVSWQRDRQARRSFTQSQPFANPLDSDERREFRWYLEDYLQFPYGAEENHADQVEGEMRKWGESLFAQVFAPGTGGNNPVIFYQEAVREGLEKCELCISSDDPAFLNVPWELLRDPTPGGGYLAPSLGGFYRQRTAQRIGAPIAVHQNGPFRVLLVICRPYGAKDVPLSTVAQPILEAIRPLRPAIELDVLRPPTFDALAKRLTDKRGYYHLVHFDGHGVFARMPAGTVIPQYRAMANKGHLVFENEVGKEHVVSSDDLAQALATSRVPLYVLNACQSAEEGKEAAFSSVASSLVAVGAKGVVAMSYSVYASSAALFMGRFYEKLITGAPLSEAVAAGRQALHAKPQRPSVVGPLELQDWMVPTLYQQEQGYVPIPGHAPPASKPDDEEGPVRRQRAEEVCPEGKFGFLGRDYDLVDIERLLRDDQFPCVLLTGVGGVGKTDLARGFARWYAETGGCPGGVFAVDFREKADFGQVVGSIVGHGTDFSRLSEQQQWDSLTSYLRSNPCLLVWDNFESVAGYPTGAVPLASAAERTKLARFLQALRGGKSRVIITTRNPDESWLGIAPAAKQISGLPRRAAGQMAERILSSVGRRAQEFRADPSYDRLLTLLRGHPKSLEVVIPLLRGKTPGEVIEGLQHRVDTLSESIEDASLGLAFSQLSSAARRHLPFLGLFSSFVQANMLGIISSQFDELAATYAKLMGSTLDTPGWERILGEAARAGLLKSAGGQIYELHPTVPAMLRRQLLSEIGEQGLSQLDGLFLAFYAAWSAAYFDGVRKADADAMRAVSTEEANLRRALRLGEQSRKWDEVQAIAQTLGEYYETQQDTAQWRAIRNNLLDRIGREATKGAGEQPASLWMYLQGKAAIEAMASNDLDAAEGMYLEVLKHLQGATASDAEEMMAVAYHQLGIVAEERNQFDAAEGWYKKALEIKERLGLERDAASGYHQLGRVAEERNRFDAAEEWYRKALEIKERLGLERDAATDYHQLGTVAQERNQLDAAEGWYKKALEIFERLGLERDAASEYHQLGMVAQERTQFDAAEGWYKKALEIEERLGLERDAATDYHQLGMVAEERSQFEAAEGWYKKALEIKERLGLERNAASDYHQLGNIALERNQFDAAEGWYKKALEIKERLGLERDAADEYHQLGIIAEKRNQFDRAEGWCKKALEIYERLGHPPLKVITLAQMGVLRRRQGNAADAIVWFGSALAIAAEHKMRQTAPILVYLVRCMDAVGQAQFAAVWKDNFKEDPPMEVLLAVKRRMEEGNAKI